MRVRMALSDADAHFVLVEVSEDFCPQTGRMLQVAASQALAGIPALLVRRDGRGDVRSFGSAEHSLALAEMPLGQQRWVEFELLLDERDLGSEAAIPT